MKTNDVVLSAALLLAGVVLAGGLGGCACRPQTTGGLRVGLPPQEVVAVLGRPLELRVENPPPGFRFQWQKNGLDIPGAQNQHFVEQKVTLESAGLYRCKLQSSDEAEEADYTTEVALYTVGSKAHYLTMASVTTPVAGPFQPSQPGTQSYCGGNKTTNYVRFRTAGNSIWFKPPANTKTCRVTDTSQPGGNYVGRIEALESGTLKYFCGTGTPSTVSFPVAASRSYQFVLFVLSSPPPPTGKTLSAEIVWEP